MQKHYIDIFDDGLYEKDPELASDFAREARQLIRIQSLWAILFDGQVVVPEQWAISSPAFFDVAAEIGENLEAFMKDRHTTADERSRTLHAPPLVVGLAPENRDYRSALVARLSVADRPIQGLQRLNTFRHQDAGERRLEMAKAVDDWRADGEAAYRTPRLADQLSSVLDSAALGNHIASTIGYFSGLPSSMFQAAPYEPAFGSELRKLRSYVFIDRPLHYVFGDDIALLRDVFSRLDRENIALENSPGVINLLSTYGEVERERVLHIGRLSVHNACAGILRCTVGSITYDTFVRDKQVEFDRMLIDQAGLDLHPDPSPQPNLGAFEQTFYFGRKSKVDDLFRWNEIWHSVFRLAYSQDWLREREVIAQRIGSLPLTERWNHETWDDLFDTVTSRLASVEMRRDGDDPSSFRFGIAPQTLKGLKATGESLLATGALTAGLPQLSIPIGALGALFFGLSKVADPRLIAKGILGGRKIARKVRALV